ncbi:MAG: hypothetical protein EOM40_05310 [Clostridia bacterium]|nr:hypothetical protein [Clostridia bacterium]NCC44115.1 hypothetical protein [Clostridia bacterium]
MAGIQLKVSSSELIDKSHRADILIGEIQAEFDKFTEIIGGSSAYWTGEAADSYRTEYRQGEKHISEAVELLKGYPKRLMQMAGIYEEAEAKSDQVIESLPMDVID